MTGIEETRKKVYALKQSTSKARTEASKILSKLNEMEEGDSTIDSIWLIEIERKLDAAIEANNALGSR